MQLQKSTRKRPVQQRSLATVEVIFDATIQVLLGVGMERLTTTKVAERAGVSVGTLYQYFPNKESLLTAVLERHLGKVLVAVELACETAKGQATEGMAAGLVRALIAAKFREPLVSRALYAVTADAVSKALITQLAQRSQLAICDMLATSATHKFHELSVTSFMLVTALVGPIQAVLEADNAATLLPLVEQHLIAMTCSYLERVGIRADS